MSLPSRLSPLYRCFIGVLFALLSALQAAAHAAEITDAWARSTVKGQMAAAAYLTVTSATAARLVGVSSPAAAVVQLHEMSMVGTTMRMRPLAGIDLPAGQPVELKPGGMHVMLQDLRQPLTSGDRLPVILRFEGPDNKVTEQAVSIEVRDAPPMMRKR